MRWRMLTADILELKSGDGTWYRNWHGFPGTVTVGEFLGEKDISDQYHQGIREEMRKAGINLVPVHVEDDRLLNGLHRVKIAISLGHEEMMVSDWEHECGYEEGWRKEIVHSNN